MKRSPIVVVLGHVDHGKSTLLDTLRKSRITAGEAGGITQSIGAYQFVFPGGEKKITFIDTPGHEAFSRMRSSGAEVADLALLVVAADDGVQPQTLEAMEHIKTAGIPVIVVINKIDLPDVHLDKAKTQLLEHELAVEGFGGTVPVVEVSAKTGANLKDLLEMIWLVYELSGEEKEKKGEALLEAPVIESRLDDRVGPLVSVVVRSGRLAVGDRVKAGAAAGKIKALIDGDGRRVDAIQPGEPAQILGFKKVPAVGAVVSAESGLGKKKNEAPPETKAGTPPAAGTEKGETLILKADSAETLQALTDSISTDQVIKGAAVGEITESDILLAVPEAVVAGFRVKPTRAAAKLAQREGVRIVTDEIIYRLLDQIEQLKEEKTVEIRETGRAKVIKTFKVEGKKIAGCMVEKGKLAVGDKVRIISGDSVIGEGAIASLKHRAKILSLAKAGEECGVEVKSPEGDLKIIEGAVIMAYQDREE